MSILTANKVLVVPSAAVGLSVPSPLTAWQYGAWVEFIASAAGNLSIAGMSIIGGTYSTADMEFEIGVGAGGAEVGIGTIRFFGGNSASVNTPQSLMLPIPMGGIVTSDRVAVRHRRSIAGVDAGCLIALMYYQALDSDQVTNLTQVWKSAPFGATGVALTPVNTGYADSNWFELTSGLGTTAGIVGLANQRPVTDIDIEYDIGIGSVGNEVVITTIRDGYNGAGIKMLAQYLPSMYFIPASTRVAIRCRKTGTSTTAFSTTLLYIAGVSGPSGSGAGKGSKGSKGGGGVNKYVPGGANLLNIGNPALDFG